jgi:FKBP-type peptidyl-prolyl cis-trans isomerase (trigger factor)
MNQTHQTLQIDRSVFQKSQEERNTLKDLKQQVKKQLQSEHGNDWKKIFSKPIKL